jgi:NAD(P)-dependent dehydrogenase (short-subunit alcohol dehydrogenase family)
MGACVVLVCRNQQKGEAALADIRRHVPSAQLDLLLADMSSLDSVRALAAQIEQRYPRIDVLINNAGAALRYRTLSADGIEMTLAGNHVGPALLALLLVDRMKASAPSRIVNVSSEAHRSARLHLDDLQYEKNTYNGLNAYGQSKLLMNAFTFELARRLDGTGVTVNCLHPGVVNTNIWPTDVPFIGKVLIALMKPFMLNAQKGAVCTLHVATAPELAQVTGQYFVKSAPVAASPLSRDPDVISEVWRWTEKMVGATSGGPAAY